jgi:Tol biopolymer transport system component
MLIVGLLAALTACGIFQFELQPEATQTGAPDVETPAVVSSPAPGALYPPPVEPEPTPAPGLVRGSVCFPSEFIPAMTAFFQEVTTGEVFELAIAENQTTYELTLPPGSYIAFAYLNDGDLGGLYSEAVPCGLEVSCEDHSPIEFQVIPNDSTSGVDLCDWYAPEAVPPRPPQAASPSLSGLVYRDALGQGTWFIDRDGRPGWLSDQFSLKLSPDGSQAVFERDNDLWILDLGSGQERNLTGTPERIEVGPQWWPARPGILIFGSWDRNEELVLSTGRLSIVQTDGSEYQVLEESASNALPAPGPDGQTLAYDRGGEAWLYRMGSGSERFDFSAYGLQSAKGIQAGSPAWSPDGSHLAWWLGGNFPQAPGVSLALAVFDLNQGRVTLMHPYTPAGGSDGWLPTPVWSPDGRWLAVQTRGEVDRTNLWLVAADGEQEIPLGRAEAPVWSPDGSRLVYTLWPEDGSGLADAVTMQAAAPDWQPAEAPLPHPGVPAEWLSAPPGLVAGGAPQFIDGIFFAATPDVASAQRVFPAGTAEVYALWSYAGMREGLTIRREWYLDGVLWLVREEPWDFDRYGAAGFVTDISIFDDGGGLPSGNYSLRLFIDEEEQFFGEGAGGPEARFQISEPAALLPVVSPDGTQTALVEGTGTLVVEEASGRRRELLTVGEIGNLAWFPKGENLVYTVLDRSNQQPGGGTIGLLRELWVVNLRTEATHQIGTTAENFHDPLVSPDGRHLALIAGTDFGDACYVDRKLWILELDGDLRVRFSYYQLDFTGIPDAGDAYVDRLISWADAGRLEVELKWVCADGDPDGRYRIDISERVAEKLD